MPLIDSIQHVPPDCYPDKNIQIHSHGAMLDEVFRLPPNVCVLFSARPGEAAIAHPHDYQYSVIWAWQQGMEAGANLTTPTQPPQHIDPPWFLATGVERGEWANDGPPGPLTRFKGTAVAQDIGASNVTPGISGPTQISGAMTQDQYIYSKSLYKGGQLIQNMIYSMEQNWQGDPSFTTQQFGVYDPTNREQYENFKRSQEKWRENFHLVNWHDIAQFPELGQVISVAPDSATTAMATGIAALDQNPMSRDNGSTRIVTLFEIIKKLTEKYGEETKILINASPCRVCRPLQQDQLLEAVGVGRQTPLGRTGSLGDASPHEGVAITWKGPQVESRMSPSELQLQLAQQTNKSFQYSWRLV